jgi:hypothetical protein
MVILYPTTKTKLTEAGTTMGGILVFAGCFSCFFLFFVIKRRLQRKRLQLSEKTYKMHKNLTMGLLVQVKKMKMGNKNFFFSQMLAPIVCIALPIFVKKILEYHQINNDFITPMAFSAVVYYHFFSAFATLYFVKPYGKACMRYLLAVIGSFTKACNNNSKRTSSMPNVISSVQ